ncbi:F0F1 ATP synthase subunit epsilon [Desulfoscipio gibsoniae]|uniref:Alternate F1F0 ATPase, F1 subunit epsilon n=1 Tax=Desulfoscipio gibsoniae DSM 7213 TaxID=767817 RepID=R4KL78_9FIRM|nr:F0F1 ATP synthase subunit epsilon [Desulfoscipio gibsoniae]AGL03414.1 alternate F1F0 ATPase, F1 subunit epsilon [Desulfoscipio gibsoniae DSM 7213]
MKLKVLLPTEVFLEEEVTKVSAEAENGSFCLLPRHIDFVTAIVPGLVSFITRGGEEVFLAVDSGILVKCGPEVLVSTRRAVRGPVLGELKDTILREFRTIDEREEQARSVMAKLEASFVRRFIKLEEDTRG